MIWRFRPDPKLRRADEVRRLHRYLLQSRYPRLQMLLLVALTAGAGALASFVLLQTGTTGLALRYGLSVLIAYAVFLGLLWLWLRTSVSEWLDAPDLMPRSSGSRSSVAEDVGNAAADVADATLRWRPDIGKGNSRLDAGSSGGDVDGFGVLDLAAADEAAIPIALLLLLLVVLATIVLALGSVVWSAPMLFAELLFDGVLAAGLYRRLRRADAQHWLQAALRHTFWPFALSLAFVVIAGFALQHYAPDATTLSQALDSAAQRSP
jgi:hypothetical protein